MIPEIIKITADPAAGSEIVWTADEDCIVHVLKFNFVTSAVVANRVVGLTTDDGNPANVFWRTQASFNHAASANLDYAGAEAVFPQTLNSMITFSLPAQGIRLRKGDRLRTQTVSLDVGDNFTSMWIQAERTMEGAQ